MKKVLLISATTLLVLVVLIGLGAIYIIFLKSQDRGTTADGRMAPPASVRNAAEAPKYDASSSKPSAKTAEKPAEYQLPTELDITTPQVPEGLSAPASGEKT